MNGQDVKCFGDQIERLTRDAVKTTILTVPGLPAGHFYAVGPDGKATPTIAPPPWNQISLETPGELLAFAQKEKGGGSVVFYNDEQAQFLPDAKEPRHRAFCSLRKSEPFLWLESAAANGKQMRQPDFVRLLRVTFRGCLGNGNALALVRNLKFTNDSEANANIQHGRESIGRSVKAAVTGTDALPEDLSMDVPVFDNHPYVARVVCALEVFPQEQTFRLAPYPGEVSRAVDAALLSLADLLGKSELPVYRGKP